MKFYKRTPPVFSEILSGVLTDSNRPLASLIQRAQNLVLLNNNLKKFLPAELVPHCKAVHYENGSLILSVSSAAFLTPLRYSQTALLQSLRQDPTWAHLRNLSLKISSPIYTEIEQGKQNYHAPEPCITPEQYNELKDLIKKLRS